MENPGTFRVLLKLGNDIPELLIPILPLDALALLVIAGVASYFKEGAALAINRIMSRLAWDALFGMQVKRLHTSSLPTAALITTDQIRACLVST
ncbi:hypothetical protein BD769DRAFT_70638 [Suillus cothurnatus]|nr:hypothetical protein BD769DRAFT_70638 [Suillus cothurnatus]